MLKKQREIKRINMKCLGFFIVHWNQAVNENKSAFLSTKFKAVCCCLWVSISKWQFLPVKMAKPLLIWQNAQLWKQNLMSRRRM